MSQLAMSYTPAQRGGRIVRAGIVATIAAVLGNVLVFFVAAAINNGPLLAPHPQTGEQVPVFLGAPIILTAIGIIGATLVFALIKRRSSQPVRTFAIVSLAVLVLSYAAFLLPIAFPWATVAAFGAMHLVAAAIAVPILIALGK